MKANLIKRLTLTIAALLLITACNKRISDVVDIPPDVPQAGADLTLEVATWNIEQFPLRDDFTVDKVSQLILGLDIDLYAVQEIVSVQQMEVLMDSLNNGDTTGAAYRFRLNPGISGDLKTGIIYKSSIITILSESVLFSGNSDASYEFASRLPYAARLRAANNGREFDFTIVVLHLKAFGDETSEERRRQSIQRLEAYISGQLANPANDPDYIVLGDWNDVLNDPPADNVFLPFLQDTTQYEFLTLPLAGNPNEYTFIDGFNSLIDHIMITKSVDAQYPTDRATILRLDEEISGYIPDVSDHRPVVVTFPVFQ